MQQLIEILKAEPIKAIKIAEKLGLVGSWERNRRKVRSLVKDLRDEGEWVIASLSWGYFLTTDFALWNDYVNNRKIDALRILAEVSKRKKVVVGQGNLFEESELCNSN